VTTTALTRSATIWRVILPGATESGGGASEHAWLNTPPSSNHDKRKSFSIRSEETTDGALRHI
jgi:hypothetical protein